MTTSSYNQASPSSIESFGQRLVRSTLRKTPGVKEIPLEDLQATEGVKFKGKFGTILETYYGINPGNEPCSPDFKTAGVELKTTALKKGRRGFSAKERLSLGMIDYDAIVHESFESSCLMAKNRQIMLISRRYENGGVLVDARIEMAALVTFSQLPKADRQIIKEDWKIIYDKIMAGQAHTLSSSDTKYLEASTKGNDGSKRVSQPYSDEPARPRGFAFKPGYVSGLVNRYMKNDPGYLDHDQQLAISNASEMGPGGFEATITEMLAPYIGLTVGAIEARLGELPNKSAKGYRATLARRMLGVNTRKIAEFERSGIELKTILIHENGLPKEHISFPAFKYMGEGSILEEDWDAVQADNDDEDVVIAGNIPEIKYRLESTRFLFVVFTKDEGIEKLSNARFWSMSKDDIETFVKPVWEHTYDAINSGQLDNLPKIQFNHVCHVRPHARNLNDTYPTPHNGDQEKKSFWLDKSYIQNQLSGART